MTKEFSDEVVSAIELLYNIPDPESASYQIVINDVYNRIGCVWGNLKEIKGTFLENELDEMFSHPRIRLTDTHDGGKDIELKKQQLKAIIEGNDGASSEKTKEKVYRAGEFSDELLTLFGISGGSDLFMPWAFRPKKTKGALLRITGISRKRIRKLVGGFLHEDWEKAENINDVITQGFSLLRERLYLLRMPVSRLVEEVTRRTLQADAYLEAERYSEFIRETSTLMRRIGGSTNPDALEALDEAHSNAHKILDELGEIGEMKSDITVGNIQQDIREHFGVSLTSKNPHHVIDPRNGKKIIQRHLIKAAYQIYPDLTNLIRLQNSIRGIRKSITSKEELTDAQKLLIDDIASHYSQSIIRKIFDEAFYRFAILFKRPR